MCTCLLLLICSKGLGILLVPVQWLQILAQLEDAFLANIAYFHTLRKYCCNIVGEKGKNKASFIYPVLTWDLGYKRHTVAFYGSLVQRQMLWLETAGKHLSFSCKVHEVPLSHSHHTHGAYINCRHQCVKIFSSFHGAHWRFHTHRPKLIVKK